MFNTQQHTPTATACEAGYEFEPHYPGSTQGIGAKIKVRGLYSPKVREFLRSRMLAAQTRDLEAKSRGQKPELLTLEANDQESIDLAVAYTSGWSGFVDGDAPLECTDANLRRIYADHPWLRPQVIDHAENLGNFVGPNSAALLPTSKPSGGLT